MHAKCPVVHAQPTAIGTAEDWASDLCEILDIECAGESRATQPCPLRRLEAGVGAELRGHVGQLTVRMGSRWYNVQVGVLDLCAGAVGVPAILACASARSIAVWLTRRAYS